MNEYNQKYKNESSTFNREKEKNLKMKRVLSVNQGTEDFSRYDQLIERYKVCMKYTF